MLIATNQGNGVFMERYSTREERDSRTREIRASGGKACKLSYMDNFQVDFRPREVVKAMRRKYRAIRESPFTERM